MAEVTVVRLADQSSGFITNSSVSATYATKVYADAIGVSSSAAAVNYLTASAPAALNTLDELAAALGDDSNFATTITNLIAQKITSVPGMISPYAGFSSPSGWLLCDGSTVSRSTYSSLFSNISNSWTTATVTNASTTVSGLTGMSASDHVGWGIAGTNIPSGATIASVTNSTTVVISAAATGTATGTANIAISAYGFTGSGNTTTFNIPDLRGRSIIGKDNMGGTSANRVTLAISGISSTILGSSGGSERLHQHTHANTVSGTFASSTHSHGATDGGGDLRAAIGATGSDAGALGYIATGVNGPGSTGSYTIFGSSWTSATRAFNHYTPVYGTTSGPSATASVSISNVANAETGTSQNISPAIIMNYIIKT